jgi:hypothetical protein
MLSFDKNTKLFIDKRYKDRHINFYQTDLEDTYFQNKNKMGESWYYFDNPIDYKFNKLGFRFKEIEEVDDNFLLSFGCSYTEGVGLHYEDLWVTKLANSLNLDFMNFAKSSSSVDNIIWQTIFISNYLKKNNKIPKFVIYQIPFYTRTQFVDIWGDEIDIVSQNLEMNYKNLSFIDEYYKYFFIETQIQPKINILFLTNMASIIWESMGSKVIYFSLEPDSESKEINSFLNNEVINIYDYTVHEKNKLARDLSHNGRFGHDIIVEELQKIIKNG